MNENTNKRTISPTEGLFLAAESAGLTLRSIDQALDLVAEQLLELGSDQEDRQPYQALHAVLCLVQENARHTVAELRAARREYLDAESAAVAALPAEE